MVRVIMIIVNLNPRVILGIFHRIRQEVHKYFVHFVAIDLNLSVERNLNINATASLTLITLYHYSQRRLIVECKQFTIRENQEGKP